MKGWRNLVLFLLILFENLFKPRQRRLAVYMLLTSSVLSTTSKQCFEQPAASFLVCSLIFIEYKYQEAILNGMAFLSPHQEFLLEHIKNALIHNGIKAF